MSGLATAARPGTKSCFQIESCDSFWRTIGRESNSHQFVSYDALNRYSQFLVSRTRGQSMSTLICLPTIGGGQRNPAMRSCGAEICPAQIQKNRSGGSQYP